MKRNPNDFKLTKKVREKLKDHALIRRELASGKTAQEIIGFSNESMAELYQAACELLEHRRYVDSANAFLFLATLNAYQHDYWLGLGMATQLTGDFEGAIDAYELAAICDVENPIPYFYLAKCLFAIHDRQSAREALEVTITHAGEHPHYQELKQLATAALAQLDSDSSGPS